MQSHSVCSLACALLVLSLANCGDSDNPVPGYLKNTWGIQISGFTGDIAVAADGTQSYVGTGKITVDGLGSADIASETVISPLVTGGETTLYVSNLDGSNERYFVYDQINDDIEIGSLTKGVAVARNEDGTYAVWLYDGEDKEQEVQVPNGFEALKLVEQYNEFKTISPYILLSAFAFAHNSAPEARLQIKLNTGQERVAATPVVCELFKEFCDCAACLVLKRQGACGLCPQL